MKSKASVKSVLFVTMLFVVFTYAMGQTTLPFTYDGGNPGTLITGLSQSGLGTDYLLSPKIKFDTQNDYLVLNFSGVPGTLSFKIKWYQGFTASRFPGDFTLQESADGITYSTVQLYNSTNGTALPNGTIITETFSSLLSASRYLKWIYTAKSNGNIAIGAISLTAGNTPTLNVSTNTFTGFSYVCGAGPSAEQSVNVSGSNLMNNISLTPPVDFEISKGSGTLFVATNPVTLIQSEGIVGNTTIYTRLKSGLVSGNYAENITVASLGLNSTTISCSGTVIANPRITLTDITDPTLSTSQGRPVSQTINVSGVNLSVDLGLALSGVDAGLFSLSQYAVTQSGGNVPNTAVTITYTPNTVGSNTAFLTMTSTGAMPVIRTLNGISSLATDVNSPKGSLNLYVDNGNILFKANEGEIVEIYNPIGQRMIQKMTIEGLNIIPVTSHGVLLVKVGNRMGKVII